MRQDSSGQYSNFVGNAGKVVFRGPGENNWDVALFKNFPIKEHVTHTDPHRVLQPTQPSVVQQRG